MFTHPSISKSSLYVEFPKALRTRFVVRIQKVIRSYNARKPGSTVMEQVHVGTLVFNDGIGRIMHESYHEFL